MVCEPTDFSGYKYGEQLLNEEIMLRCDRPRNYLQEIGDTDELDAEIKKFDNDAQPKEKPEKTIKKYKDWRIQRAEMKRKKKKQ